VVPEVMKASKAVEVSKAREVVSWKERAMVKRMYSSPSAGHAKVVCAAEAMDATKAAHAAVHPAGAVASKTTHGVGRQWRGKHRHRKHIRLLFCGA
jgi:hypothetical protein